MHDHPAEPDLLRGVLAAIRANRVPGWNFAGHYIGITYRTLDERLTVATCPSRPELLDTEGRLDVSVLAVLCDLAMASCARPRVGMGTRLATVTMSIFLHGALGDGELTARSRLLSDDSALGLVTSAAELRCSGVLQATAMASFLAMRGAALPPVPATGAQAASPAGPVAAIDLSEGEQAVMDRAMAAAAPGTAGFLSRFWGAAFTSTAQGADGVFETGQHTGNRVGHMQGGLLFALAAAGGAAAAGGGYRVVAMHANYSRPGRSPRLHIHATCVHRGGTTASTTVAVLDDEGTTLLSALVELVRQA